jgi:outer membrane murein-binding lipoprotein Lpp
MWLLNFLPDWILYALAVGSLIIFVIVRSLTLIPILYRSPIQLLSAAIFVFTIYLIGGVSNQQAWEQRVKEMEAKVAAAEQQSKQVNTKIQTKVVEKIQIVRQRGDDIIKYVDKEVVKYDDKFAPGTQCELPKEFIGALNKAAEAPSK